jgi:hypothetical protein
MFKLVGDEYFSIFDGDSEHRCVISIDASGLSYVYTLQVDGKPFEKFQAARERVTQSWTFTFLDGNDEEKHLVVFGRCFDKSRWPQRLLWVAHPFYANRKRDDGHMG